ncbi:hypothetical protein A0H81_00767 [Grifola frondosa]|uniref:MYND-type domain-containing protein n=1 Tax=Grifola frondosa TaxID=5627 RepID=A0A1C7MT44_GRIFR|nr:hypothetical protein A0H81_00767 [Grifola frondosa]
MGRLDDAERFLNKALESRLADRSPNAWDIATTRENLAQVQEVRGNLKEAKALRMIGAPDEMCCSNYNCTSQVTKLATLRTCSVCRSIFYCCTACQKQDWKRHKAYCKRT